MSTTWSEGEEYGQQAFPNSFHQQQQAPKPPAEQTTPESVPASLSRCLLHMRGDCMLQCRLHQSGWYLRKASARIAYVAVRSMRKLFAPSSMRQTESEQALIWELRQRPGFWGAMVTGCFVVYQAYIRAYPSAGSAWAQRILFPGMQTSSLRLARPRSHGFHCSRKQKLLKLSCAGKQKNYQHSPAKWLFGIGIRVSIKLFFLPRHAPRPPLAYSRSS